LPALAAELLQSQVAVFAATGGDPAVLAARAATTTIPIVFTTGADPVALGYVASLHRPGGNVTGVVLFTSRLGAKRIGLLRQLLPNIDAVGVLVTPTYPVAAAQLKEVEAAARVSMFDLSLQKRPPTAILSLPSRLFSNALARFSSQPTRSLTAGVIRSW